MPTIGTNTENFTRILNTTIADYLSTVEENIYRDRALLSDLKSAGRVIKQNGGDSVKWPMKYKRASLNTMGDMPDITFARINRHTNAELGPRGYWLSDAISLWEKYQNQGPAAIVKIATNLVTDLMDDFTDAFGDQLYLDGNIGDTKGIHGIESFLSTSGALSGNDKVGLCDDNYAGLSTAQGVKGLWDAVNFPEGTGTPGYHYNTPLCLDSGVDYGASTDDWANSCLRMLRYATLHQLNRRAPIGCWLFNVNSYIDIANLLEEREQIHNHRGDSAEPTLEAGFSGIKYEGVKIKREYGVPETTTDTRTTTLTTHGYGFNVKKITLRHWSPKLIHALPIDFSIESMSDRIAVLSMCNMFNNPQHWVKLAAWT